MVAAVVLAELERETGRRAADLFDVFAGTSTGAILALALAAPVAGDGAPYDARRLVAFYDEEGPRIFSRSPLHLLLSLGGLRGPKYSANALESALDAAFGDVRLSQVLRDVLVTSYDIERREPFFFKSWNARESAAQDFALRDVARASSAGPTYFPPLKLPVDDAIGYRALVDGGVYANNPAMCAYAEVLRRFPEAESVLVVSVGTGQATREIPYTRARRWGIAKWARPLIEVVFDGVADTVTYELRQLLPLDAPRRGRFYRFQIELSEASPALDAASPDNIRRLKEAGYDVVRNADRESFERLVAELRPMSPPPADVTERDGGAGPDGGPAPS